jgi:hypothetical protein
MSTDTKAPLEGGPDAPAGSSLREAVERAVLSTSTSALRKDGIESLRVLSESRLLEILSSSLRGARRAPDPDEARRSCEQDELREQYRREWELLKAKHQESLQRMEERMERLAQVFQELSEALARIEGKQRERDGREPTSDPESRRRELLREMFSPQG